MTLAEIEAMPVANLADEAAHLWLWTTNKTLEDGFKVMRAWRYKRNVILTGPPKRHSEKPEAAFVLIESVSPGPRLELFARRPSPGWTVWGNDVNAVLSPSKGA
jgi:N6-adenosine-specific RNA methylase IME4